MSDPYGESISSTSRGSGRTRKSAYAPANRIGAVFPDDVGRRQRQPPARVPIHQGDVYQDAAVILLLGGRDRVGQAELGSQPASGIGQNGEGKTVLHCGEVVLAHGLRGDPDEQRAALAHGTVQISPGLKLGDAVRAPAPAEEVDDQRAEGQQVGAAHDATRSVGQGKFRGLRANLQDSILYPRCVELRHRALADLEAFRLDKVSRVGRDLIELVLQFRHKGVL